MSWRLSWLFLFLLPLAAMAAGEDGDTLSVTWVDGRKFVVFDFLKKIYLRAYFEDEHAYWKRMEQDSAGLFYPYSRYRDWKERAAEKRPEGATTCIWPELLLESHNPAKPYWLRALRQAFSPATLERLEQCKKRTSMNIDYIHDQDGQIHCLRFHLYGYFWLTVPPEELARLNQAFKEHLLFYVQFKYPEERPARYFVRSTYSLEFSWLLDPKQN